MNEEFAISLKTILDQSSINQVKQQLSQLKQEIQGQMQQATAPASEATRVFNPDAVTQYSARIEYLMWQIDVLKEDLKAMYEHPELWDPNIILKTAAELETLQAKLDRLMNSSGSAMAVVQKTTVNIKSDMKSAVNSAKRFIGSLIGATGVYSAIRKAMRTYLSQNEELQNKLNACWYALGSLFAPALEYVVNLFVKLVSYVDAFVKALGFAGVNMANYGKAAAKASKQVAGFDEINNVSQNSGSGGGAFTMPEVDTKWVDLFKNNLPTILSLLGGIAGFIIAIKLGLSAIQGLGIGLIIMGIVGFISDLVAYIKDPSWQNFLKVLIDIGAIISGILILVGAVTGGWALLLGALVVAIFVFRDQIAEWLVDIGTKIKEWGENKINAIKEWWENFKETTSKLWNEIWTRVKQDAKQDWENIKTIFKNALENIKTWISTSCTNIKTSFKTSLDNIKTWFSTTWNNILSGTKKFWNDIKSGVSSAFTTIGNTISTKVKSIINTYVISPVNRLLSWLNDKLNFSYGGLTLLGKEVIPSFSVRLGNFGQIPMLNVGTNYVPNDMIAQLHQGEAVVPKEFNEDQFNNSEETNELLRQLIEVVDSKEFRAYISQNDIGKSAVNYINNQSRIRGGALI